MYEAAAEFLAEFLLATIASAGPATSVLNLSRGFGAWVTMVPCSQPAWSGSASKVAVELFTACNMALYQGGNTPAAAADRVVACKNMLLSGSRLQNCVPPQQLLQGLHATSWSCSLRVPLQK
jgi:hypothetical protein